MRLVSASRKAAAIRPGEKGSRSSGCSVSGSRTAVHSRTADAEHRQPAEDPAPRPEQHDDLPDGGREDRHREEDDEGERHHPRHVAAAVAVAHDRDREHARRRRADAHQHAGDKQQREGGREGREDAEHHIGADADHQHRLAAEPIGQRPVDDLRGAEAEQIGGDDPLPLVLVADPEALADGGQCRQHGIDREGIDRHQGGDQGDELLEPHAGCGRGRSCGERRHGSGLRLRARPARNGGGPWSTSDGPQSGAGANHRMKQDAESRRSAFYEPTARRFCGIRRRFAHRSPAVTAEHVIRHRAFLRGIGRIYHYDGEGRPPGRVPACDAAVTRGR